MVGKRKRDGWIHGYGMIMMGFCSGHGVQDPRLPDLRYPYIDTLSHAPEQVERERVRESE